MEPTTLRKGSICSGNNPSFPCGVCRQVMREFCGDGFLIYLGGPDGKYETRTMSDILPDSFSAAGQMQEYS